MENFYNSCAIGKNITCSNKVIFNHLSELLHVKYSIKNEAEKLFAQWDRLSTELPTWDEAFQMGRG